MEYTSVGNFFLSMNSWVLRSIIILSVAIPFLLYFAGYPYFVFFVLFTPLFLIIISVEEMITIQNKNRKNHTSLKNLNIQRNSQKFIKFIKIIL